MIPLALGTELIIAMTDVFVPLTGRIGVEAPAEHIVATLIAVMVPLAAPLILPLAFRIPPQNLKGVLFLLRIVTTVAVAYFVFQWGHWAFDSDHPRRMYISLSENVRLVTLVFCTLR